jgi:C4-dicarboxylate-specific signal transduction histidine kinase
LAEIRELTLQAVLSEKYRQAYLHDLRGGLQAIRNSLELLARTLKTAAEPAVVEKASEFAKRALAGHERAIEQTVDHMILRDEPAAPVDLAALLRELLGFLQNEITARGMPVNFPDSGSMTVHAQRGRLRLVLLGLLTTAIDLVPKLTSLDLRLGREANDVVLELPGGNAYDRVDDKRNDAEWGAAGVRDASEPFDQRRLTWSVSKQFVEANGGSLAVRADGPAAGILRLGYPLWAS